jgi:hypothetical protein
MHFGQWLGQHRGEDVSDPLTRARMTMEAEDRKAAREQEARVTRAEDRFDSLVFAESVLSRAGLSSEVVRTASFQLGDVQGEIAAKREELRKLERQAAGLQATIDRARDAHAQAQDMVNRSAPLGLADFGRGPSEAVPASAAHAKIAARARALPPRPQRAESGTPFRTTAWWAGEAS